MSKMMHAVILLVFGAACWFMSLILKLPLMVQPATARLPGVPPGQAVLPAFTRLCIYVWVRKAERPAPWTGFLATTMSALVVVLLPTVVAIYIPLVDFLNRSTAALPK